MTTLPSPPPGTSEVGIDIIKVDRIRKAIAKHGRRFAKRVLTDHEDAYGVVWHRGTVAEGGGGCRGGEGDDEHRIYARSDGRLFILREGHARPIEFRLGRGKSTGFVLHMGPRKLRASAI